MEMEHVAGITWYGKQGCDTTHSGHICQVAGRSQRTASTHTLAASSAAVSASAVASSSAAVLRSSSASAAAAAVTSAVRAFADCSCC